jgi:uncharacterized protein YbjT (DUF2867 family)
MCYRPAMVLVVGATGVLGRHVVAQLRDRGRAVRAMTRTPAKAADLIALGAEVVAGDLTAPASLARACANVTQVVASAHGMIGRGRYRSEAVDQQGHRALAAAARSAGVEHLVYLSVLGASPSHPVDFFRTKHAMEQHLRASGLAVTVVRAAAFMEWHAHEFNGKRILATGGTTLLGRGTKRRNFVAAADVARIVVKALEDRAMRGETIEIGGPGNYTDDEVAAMYGRAAGITPRVRHVPPGVLRAVAAVLRPAAPGISRVIGMAALDDDAWDATFDGAPTAARHQLTLTSLEQFIADQLRAHPRR